MRSAEPTATARRKTAAQKPPVGLWFCNWQIWLAARQLLDTALAPLELRAREYWLLGLVAQGPASQQELAVVAGVDPSSMVGLLDGLEAQGLLRRGRNPRDRRVHLIGLTAAGRARLSQAEPLAQQAERRQLAQLAPAERQRLLRLLRRLVA